MQPSSYHIPGASYPAYFHCIQRWRFREVFIKESSIRLTTENRIGRISYLLLNCSRNFGLKFRLKSFLIRPSKISNGGVIHYYQKLINRGSFTDFAILRNILLTSYCASFIVALLNDLHCEIGIYFIIHTVPHTALRHYIDAIVTVVNLVNGCSSVSNNNNVAFSFKSMFIFQNYS